MHFQSPDDLAAKASPSNDFPVPLDDQRLISVEKGERGTSQFKETFVPVDVRQEHHLRFADDIVLITPSISQAERMLADFGQLHHLRFADDIVLITPSISQAERMLADFDRIPIKTDDDTPTFEKLEAMIDDLQLMLKKVKQNILDQAANRTTEKPAESEDMSDPISEEMERKVVEDVIERMRGSFMRAARGSKTMNEVGGT
ncbi:unnamed protein product [Heligmosomoides polygyrus]|uniref:Reverse transcriptase domain-containing protein n=1 Tax=Heligmosomoides polygyrus TaxID=6339 RepID=A0A183G9W5_HELPZ|nr:unnamed protein product [Heligmosomoides polygyrus]